MSLLDWFTSRHTRYLESEIARLHSAHEVAIENLRKQHETELNFARQELAGWKEESERLRRFLIPTIQPVYDQVRAATIDEPPPAPPKEIFGGTPWQRILRREMQEQEEEEASAEKAAKMKKAAEDAIANPSGG